MGLLLMSIVNLITNLLQIWGVVLGLGHISSKDISKILLFKYIKNYVAYPRTCVQIWIHIYESSFFYG